MSGPPRTFAVVPVHNGAAVLPETLRAVLAQSAPPAGVVVVDDGSTDESAGVAASFAGGPVPVTVIRQANAGESRARNVGVAAAREAGADWVAFCDADDVWEPHKLERQHAALAAAPADVACVYSDFDFLLGPPGAAERRPADPLPERHADPDPHVSMLLGWSVLPSTAVVRADLAQAVGFPEWLRDGEDYIFFLELRGRGPFVKVPEPLTLYRRTPGQQTAAPGHRTRQVAGLLTWLEKNEGRYAEEQLARVRSELAARVAAAHGDAVWARDLAEVRRCRALHARLLPGGPKPAAMARPLAPRWVYRMKDGVDAVRGKLTTASAGGAA